MDLTKNPEIFEKLGFKKEDGLKALHAQNKDGSIHIAVDAFILIWRQLKRWNLLANLIALPIIKQVAEFFYKHFANWRFRKLGYEECMLSKE